jgi:hypothetical protein
LSRNLGNGQLWHRSILRSPHFECHLELINNLRKYPLP